MVGIYKIISPTGRIYIGQSWNIDKRKNGYKNCTCRKQRKLYNSLKKYGWCKHIFKIIHELPKDVTQKILDRYEIFYWQLYKDCDSKMLNIKDPGIGGKHSEETKQILREKGTGRLHTEETKVIIKEKRKNQIITPENKERLRTMNIGRKFGKEFAMKVSLRRKGTKLSKVTKEKIAEANKKSVLQYSMDGNFIKEWDSCKEASLNLPVSASSIAKCARGVFKQANGFIFKYKTSE